ncbi:MAG: GNAT family N-acetyltransferase [Deinococcus sp.]|nr:GNAT family N-acetyltransferase [Deinococcus sp.]
MSAFLHTQRLSLRPLEPTDLPLLQGLNADPEVMRYLEAGMPLSHTQTADHELPRLLGLTVPGLGRSCWVAFSHGTFTG